MSDDQHDKQHRGSSVNRSPGVARETQYFFASQFCWEPVEEYASECLSQEDHQQYCIHREIRGSSLHVTCAPSCHSVQKHGYARTALLLTKIRIRPVFAVFMKPAFSSSSINLSSEPVVFSKDKRPPGLRIRYISDTRVFSPPAM
jgi:hypothetical protein